MQREPFRKHGLHNAGPGTRNDIDYSQEWPGQGSTRQSRSPSSDGVSDGTCHEPVTRSRHGFVNMGSVTCGYPNVPSHPTADVNVHPSWTQMASHSSPLGLQPSLSPSLSHCQTHSFLGHLALAVPSAWNSPRPGISSVALSDLLKASAQVSFPLGNCNRFPPPLNLLCLFLASRMARGVQSFAVGTIYCLPPTPLKCKFYENQDFTFLTSRRQRLRRSVWPTLGAP